MLGTQYCGALMGFKLSRILMGFKRWLDVFRAIAIAIAVAAA